MTLRDAAIVGGITFFAVVLLSNNPGIARIWKSLFGRGWQEQRADPFLRPSPGPDSLDLLTDLHLDLRDLQDPFREMEWTAAQKHLPGGGLYILCGTKARRPQKVTRATRVIFSDLALAVVVGWPSAGGQYVLPAASGVDLDYLGIDRFAPSRRSESQEDEDAHCARMARLGAVCHLPDCKDGEIELLRRLIWFQQPTGHHFQVIGIVEPDEEEEEEKDGEEEEGADKKKNKKVAGRWVLQMEHRDAVSLGLGRVHNARTMEERCAVLEELGAIFIKDSVESTK